MLIHRQNLYAPRSNRHTGSREAQSRGTDQQSKTLPCIKGTKSKKHITTINNLKVSSEKFLNIIT
jgi:hypothetical protein